MHGWLAQLSAYERVTAVHKSFAEKSTDDLYPLLFWSFVLLTAALAVLAISHRVQNHLSRRREARRRTVYQQDLPSCSVPPFGTPRPTVTGLPPKPPGQYPAIRM